MSSQNDQFNQIFNLTEILGETKNTMSVCATTHIPGASIYGRLIITIHVPRQFRGFGHGSAILKRLCSIADHKSVELFVNPLSYDACPLSMFDLHCWYERHGFTSFGGVLRRTPQSVSLEKYAERYASDVKAHYEANAKLCTAIKDKP